LRALRLRSSNLRDYALRAALAKSATLTSLEELDLASLARHERYNPDPVIQGATVAALMNLPGMATVRSLNLNGNDLSRDGLRALLRSPHAASLKELSLRDTRLDGQAMAEFESAVPALRLQTLDVGENVLEDAGAEYLATTPCLGELKSLKLDRCEITLAGALQFAKKASFLGELRLLDVGDNHFGPAGLTALVEHQPAALHTLGIRDNDLSDEGAKLLADSSASKSLLELDLSQNGLGTAAADALGESEHLRGLLILRLADNPLISDAVAAALDVSPLGRRLAVLELDDQPSPELEPEAEDTPPPAPPVPPPAGGDDIPF
jgi:hypothetical protein